MSEYFVTASKIKLTHLDMESVCFLVYRRIDEINISYVFYVYIYIYAREHYFTLKEGYAINSQKWRDVEDIILSKIIQT